MPTIEPPMDRPEDQRWRSLPSQTVFALFEDENHAVAAKRRLTDAGIAEGQVRILSGKGDAALLEPRHGRSGLPEFLSRALAELSDETTYLESYAKKLREGHALIAVGYNADTKEESDADRMTIEAILIDSGGLNMSYTSDWTITVVGRGSRPS